MTQAEGNNYIIGYWERMAKENEERAAGIESLAPKLVGKIQQDFGTHEAKVLRDAALRFRESAKRMRDGLV